MPKCTITVGVSASGKSTWAMLQDTLILNRDDAREWVVDKALGEPHQGNLWLHYNFKRDEQQTQELWERWFNCYVTRRVDFIIADTNLHRDRREALIARLKGLGYEVVIQDFHITYEEALMRDSKRKNQVGQGTIYKQWRQWIQYLKDTGQKRTYEPSSGHAAAIICDIDGTLAHMQGRGPFEWHRVGEDAPDPAVISVLEGLDKAGEHSLIITSGRDEVCREQTVAWLDKWGVPYDRLLMRKQGDMRKDTIVKEEMFWTSIADSYNVRFVIDDRPSVCRMWMDLGLKVFNVGDPYVEF